MPPPTSRHAATPAQQAASLPETPPSATEPHPGAAPTAVGAPQAAAGGTRFKAPTTHRLPPVGACIYCGATKGRLTEEHIVPQGLGGTLILPKASCDPCAELTSQFEMRVLRGFMDRGRQALGIRGKRSHKRPHPAALPTTFILPGETLIDKALPAQEALKLMHLPVFALPVFLDPNRPPVPRNGIDVVALDTATFGPNATGFVREHKAVGVRFEDRMDIWAFVRMLAKIAHGYHVAVHGLFPQEQSPLLPIILGKRWDAGNWIGNTELDPLPTDTSALHLLQDLPLESEDGARGTAVRIKLFARNRTPTYALATRLQPPA